MTATRATLLKFISGLGLEPVRETAEVEGMRTGELHLARRRVDSVIADSAVHDCYL